MSCARGWREEQDRSGLWVMAIGVVFLLAVLAYAIVDNETCARWEVDRTSCVPLPIAPHIMPQSCDRYVCVERK